MAEDLGEKTEQPTGRRRLEARRRGQVARSLNLSAFVLLAAGSLLIYFFGDAVMQSLYVVVRNALSPESLGRELDHESIKREALFAGLETLRVMGPILGIMAIVAAVEQIVQVGWFISLEPLTPKLSKFNPVTGLKRLFSKRSVVKGAIDVLKLAIIASVAYAVVGSDYRTIVALPLLTAGGAFVVTAQLVVRLVVWTLVVLLVIGLVDWLYQRWQQTEDLKMTKQEVKDERKSTEGDLETKARRMKLAREIIRQKLRTEVPKADVVVTNPTHFAVALRYDEDTMSAPRVVAKGGDYLALQIRLIAAANGVPIIERPALARALYHNVEVGREVPAEQYEAVAELLAYVYRLEGRMAS